jgi:hypothetical protein
VLQESSRQVKEVAWSIGSPPSGMDDPTCIYSCKRAYVGVRRAKRGSPHRCCKRLAEEAYGAYGRGRGGLPGYGAGAKYAE